MPPAAIRHPAFGAEKSVGPTLQLHEAETLARFRDTDLGG
jgi:hypothetical protein